MDRIHRPTIIIRDFFKSFPDAISRNTAKPRLISILNALTTRGNGSPGINFRDATWRLVDEGGGVGPKEQDCKREYENVANMARRIKLQPHVDTAETEAMVAIRQHPENVVSVIGDWCNCPHGQSTYLSRWRLITILPNRSNVSF
uniref:Uncharacterized protein n=1 Tax=Vitis vinifera TaxID=29760 RepID=A5AS26_VITVI|nr:hypothetical protein VITISV_036691 [Vitis vinifera]